MITRRDCFKYSAAAGASLALGPSLAQVLEGERLITRPIPSTGEQLPIIGLGSSASYGDAARDDELDAIRAVLQTFVDNGGTVFDTAPSYAGGDAEAVSGRLANELGIQERIFWATKVNVARGGGPASPEEARAQIEQSFQRINLPQIDCIQVHNVGDLATQLPILKEYKEEGRVRYIGVTTTFANQYQTLIDVMENEPLDFIGVDYAIDERDNEETILPLAQERGIAVLVYLPFGRRRLWNRVAGHDLPDWASEIGAESWAQFFLKFAASHPAVTCVTPSTSQARNMLDNLGAAVGPLPDEAMRRRMIELVDSLPPA